jgi:putative transposase
MPEENPQRRRIRLAPAAYANAGEICSITIAVKGRTPVFASAAVADAAVDVLRRQAAATGVPIYAWCVMPDHVHLILSASPSCDLVTFVGQFKNLALRAAWRVGIKGAFWQTSFWDHFLRGDERLAQVIEYVLQNPVRSGLVERWCDYRFSGSSVFELGGGRAPALRAATRLFTAGDEPPPYGGRRRGFSGPFRRSRSGPWSRPAGR